MKDKKFKTTIPDNIMSGDKDYAQLKQAVAEILDMWEDAGGAFNFYESLNVENDSHWGAWWTEYKNKNNIITKDKDKESYHRKLYKTEQLVIAAAGLMASPVLSPIYYIFAKSFLLTENAMANMGGNTLHLDSKRQKKFNNIVKQVLRKYPSVSTTMLWSMIYLSIFGGKLNNENTFIRDKLNSAKEWITRNRQPVNNVQIQVSNTYGEFVSQLEPLIPAIIGIIIKSEGVVRNSAGLHIPYICSAGRPTIGFGSTATPSGTVRMNMRPITTDQAFDLARWHIEHRESFFFLYAYLVQSGRTEISAAEAIGLTSVLFNTGSQIFELASCPNHQARNRIFRNEILRDHGFGTTKEMIRDAFGRHPVVQPGAVLRAWNRTGANPRPIGDAISNFIYFRNDNGNMEIGGGLVWRRFIEAGIISGDINPQDVLTMPREGASEFRRQSSTDRNRGKFGLITGTQGSHRISWNMYSDFNKWLQDPINRHGQSMKNNSTVASYLPSGQRTLALNNVTLDGVLVVDAELSRRDRRRTEEREDAARAIHLLDLDSQSRTEIYDRAIIAFRAGDFNVAAEMFENLIRRYPDNPLFRNDLSLTYYRLGRFDDALIQAREVVHRIGDRSQYGAAFFNAGRAHEQLGNIDRALANYRLAVRNGNSVAQSAIDRIQAQSAQQARTR